MNSTEKKWPSLRSSPAIMAIALVLFVLLFYPTFQSLWTRWVKFDEGLSHGLPVIGLFLYLLYVYSPWPQCYDRLKFYASLAGLLTVSLVWFLFSQIQLEILSQLSLLPLLFLLFAALFGFSAARHLSGAILLLLFAIPLWDHFNDLLLWLSAEVVGELVRWLALPALIEGNNITIPSGRILIADGCSGLRYFVISLAMAVFICLINQYSWRQKIAVVLCGLVMGLLVNWLRITLIIIIGHITEMQSSLMKDHELFGWFLFALIFIPAMYYAPVTRRHIVQQAAIPVNGLRLILTLMAMATGPLLFALSQPDMQKASPLVLDNYLPCELQSDLLPVARVTFPEEGLVREGYLSCAKTYLSLAEYTRAEASQKLVPYFQRLYDHQEWLQESEVSVVVQGHTLKLVQLRRVGGTRRYLRLYWLDVGGFVSSEYWWAKLLQIPANYFGDNRSLIIALQAGCGVGSCEAVQQQLVTLADHWLGKRN